MNRSVVISPKMLLAPRFLALVILSLISVCLLSQMAFCCGIYGDPLIRLSIIGPDGEGGIVHIWLKEETRGTNTHGLVGLVEKEITGLHDTDWRGIVYYPVVESRTYDNSTGISTTMYRYDWITTSVHNGQHQLRARVSYSYADEPQYILHQTDYIYKDVNILNLAITSVNPEGVVTWTGEESSVPVTVGLEDNDTSDPMDISVVFYDTVDKNRVGSVSLHGVTGGSHTLNWDGNGGAAAPGTYTYEVYVSQLDVNSRGEGVGDGAAYRSSFLSIMRANDDGGNPIYDAEYYGYDDKGTPEEDDDDYIYLIRYYQLRDNGNLDASEGEMWFYDPDLEKINTWNISSLECITHEANDGLHASAVGIQHALKVPVPVTMMDEGGTYRFVLHVKDDHAAYYRDHRARWAYNLNSTKFKPQAHLYDYLGVGADSTGLQYMNRHMWKDPEHKVEGYAARAMGSAANADVLKYMPKDSVWYCLGHGSPGGGAIMINGWMSAEEGTARPANVLCEQSMNKCLIAVFHSCWSSLTETDLGWGNLLQTANNIGAQCALGFSESIGIEPAGNHELDNNLPHAWSNWFFESLCWGNNRDHTARSVSQAASYAAQRIRDDCPSEYDHKYGSWETRPANSSLKVVPAR